MRKSLPESPSAWFVILALLFVSQHITLLGDLIPITLLGLPFFIFYLLGTGTARVDRRLVLVFATFSIFVVASYLYNRENKLVSYASFLYLLFLNSPFTVRLTMQPATRLRSAIAFWDAYRIMMALTAILGLLQISLADNYFSFRDFLPENWRVQGYNTTNAVVYGLPLYRANGFLFYEPSFFSQFLALAILVEMRRSRNLLLLALLLAGIIASFSGTGIALLVYGLLIQAVGAGAISVRRIAFTLMPIVIISIVGGYVYPDFFMGRLQEFSQENSSAYVRFIAPLLYIYQIYSESLGGLLHGAGPGVASTVRLAALMVDFPGIGKVMYEYGLLGAGALVVLYTVFCARTGMTSWIKWPLLLLQFVLNNGVFTPITLAFFLIMAAIGPFPEQPKPRVRRPVSNSARAGLEADGKLHSTCRGLTI